MLKLAQNKAYRAVITILQCKAHMNESFQHAIDG